MSEVTNQIIDGEPVFDQQPNPKTGALKVPAKEAAADTALVMYNERNVHLSVSAKAVNIIGNIHGVDSEGKSLMNDDQLKQFFGSVVEVEKASFVLRGAAAWELVTRVQEAGKDFNTTAGNGVDTVLKDICNELRVERSTLQEDYRIYAQFREELTENLATNPDALMSREYYRLALQTQNVTWADPKETLDYFKDQVNSQSYSTNLARRDVKRVNGGMSIEEVRKADLQEREEAANSGEKEKTKTAKERMMNIQVVASDQMQWIIDCVRKKGGSMSNWILAKGKAEFGQAPKPAPAPKKKVVKKATKAKKTTAKKTTGAKKAAAPKKTTTTVAPEGDTGAA